MTSPTFPDWRHVLRLESPTAVLLACLAGALAVTLVALPAPTFPAVFQDELCRLGWARLISGTGSHYELATGSYCQPLYPLLLAPLYWISSDGEALYRNIFLVNMLLAGACLPLAIRLGMLHLGMTTGAAWLAGLAILFFPGMALHGHHAWPETAIYPALLLAFLAWCNWIDRPDWRRFLWLTGSVLLLYGLHRKMIVMPGALAAGAVAGIWITGSPRYRRQTLLFLLGLAGFFWFDSLVKTIAMEQYWSRPDVEVLDRAARLSDPEFIQGLIGKFAGSFAYAAIATGGLVWLALADSIRAAWKALRRGFEDWGPWQRKAVFPVALLLLLAMINAFFFGTSVRFDSWFYGRHINPAIAATLIPAIALVARGPLARTTALIIPGLVLAVLAVMLLILPGPPWEDYSPVHVVGAGWVFDWLHGLDSRSALLGTCAMLLLVSCLVVVAVVRGSARYLTLLPLAAVTVATHLLTTPFTGPTPDQAFPVPVAEALQSDRSCRLIWDERIRGRISMHQFWRVQYHFPHCTITMQYPVQCPESGEMLITKPMYLDCGPDVDRLALPPDMTVYRGR